MLRAGALLFVAAVAWASDCSRTTTGLQPLNAPFFRAYRGMAGGLYPDNSNTRPAAHESAGLALSPQVRPRNAAGAIDEQSGRIVLLSIGMSNTTQEFSTLQQIANRDPEKNPRLVLVDGAQGSWSADRIVADPTTYFDTVEQRIAAAGVTGAQVEAAWVKLADSGPTLPFPDDARKLQDEIKSIIRMTAARYPNLRLVYLSSRIYAGYASSNLNPEPYSYQGGFAVKWLIEQQIQGTDPDLDYRSGKFPWLAWGPYLWADGTHMRWDGLAWSCEELVEDGTHPSALGQRKVAFMLLDFFKADSTARPWFVGAPQRPPAPSATMAANAASFVPKVTLQIVSTVFGADLAGSTASAVRLPLPYGLAGTTVRIGGELAPLYYVSPRQINLVVPPSAKGMSVVVEREGAVSASIEAQPAFFNEGLFSLDGSGQGAAAARHADGTVVSESAPALRGETIEFYGTGKGVRNPAILSPEVLPVARVGDGLARVQYFGPAPGIPGLDQINITIPAQAPAGAAVPVMLQFPDGPSNTVTIAIR
jgi:uncharacterized protein (TIGR03437 family)